MEKQPSVEVMEELRDQAQTDTIRLTFDFSAMMDARSRLSVGKQTGEDGITVSMLKTLGFGNLQEICKMFSAIYEGREPTPKDWRRIVLTLIPKSEKITSLEDTRAIAVSSCLTKWYSLSLVVVLERFLAKNLDPE
ncbi:unnamed protein product, partial [Prorocentrum cordatum]